MQVSWIDSDQLKGLLERLGDSVPQAKSGTQAWETHTMPEAAVEPVLVEEEAEVSEEVGHAWGVAEVEVREEVEASEAEAEEEEAARLKAEAEDEDEDGGLAEMELSCPEM